MRPVVALLGLCAALVLPGCSGSEDAPATSGAPATGASSTAATLVTFPAGGLTADERSEFYHLAEGSEIFPVHWFFALESETGNGMFADRLERFGLIPDPASPANPYGLPVGLTAAETRDLRFAGVEMLGVTCAACHVSEMVHEGRRIRLDGAGAHSDIAVFYLALGQAVERTVASPERALQFLHRLRQRAPSELLAAEEAGRAAAATRAVPPPGTAVSAFDRALHEGASRLLERDASRPAIDLAADHALKPGASADTAGREIRSRLAEGVTTDLVAAHAPTQPATGSPLATAVAAESLGASVHAYMRDAVLTMRLLKARLAFLHQMSARLHVKTTMPGFGRLDAFGGFRLVLFNEDPIPAPVGYPHLWTLERAEWIHWDANTTSVLERNIGQSLGVGAVLDRRTLSSSVNIANLDRLERLATKTRPPSYADLIGPIDDAKATRGEAIFKTQCARCHATSGVDEVLPPPDDVGTDDNRLRSVAEPVAGKQLSAALADMLGRVKTRAYADGGYTPAQQQAFERDRPSQWRTTGRYVASPLIGIWATAPYLHNNSVPTLADLLQPPLERPATFYAGSKEFDAERVGYRSDERPGLFLFDTRLPGNGNGGHTFGTTLSPAERADLLEYLKRF